MLKMNDALPLAAERIIPHRAPMLLLDELLDHQPDGARARAIIREDYLFVDAQGLLDPLALIEMLAQTAAAQRGYETRNRGGAAGAGFLTGLSGVELCGSAQVGEEVELTVRQTLALGQALVFEGVARCGAQELARATLKVWEEGRAETTPPAASAEQHPEKKPPDATAIESALRSRLSVSERSAEENWVVGSVLFDDDFIGFRGHFPGRAVLPGVIMLKLGELLCAQLPGPARHITRIERAKFSRPVGPGQTLRLEARLEPDAQGARALVKLSAESAAVASFVLHLGC